MTTIVQNPRQATARTARIGIGVDVVAVVALVVAAVWAAVAGASADTLEVVSIAGLGYTFAGVFAVAAVATGLLAATAAKVLKESHSVANLAAWVGAGLAAILLLVPFVA